MTVIHMIKVKVHDCLNEKIRSCKLLVLTRKFYRYSADLGNFPKIKMAVLVMLWERHTKMGEYDFYSH